jgi:hypothetical protein
MPVAANTNSVAMAVGEEGPHIILNELGINVMTCKQNEPFYFFQAPDNDCCENSHKQILG